MRTVLLATALCAALGWGLASTDAEEASGPGNPALKKLSVLYAGDPESPRTERFQTFLSEWVGKVETISLNDLDEETAAPFDVVVADWHRLYGKDGFEFGKKHGKTLGKDFGKPVVMLGAVGGQLLRPWSKITWL